MFITLLNYMFSLLNSELFFFFFPYLNLRISSWGEDSSLILRKKYLYIDNYLMIYTTFAFNHSLKIQFFFLVWKMKIIIFANLLPPNFLNCPGLTKGKKFIHSLSSPGHVLCVCACVCLSLY